MSPIINYILTCSVWNLRILRRSEQGGELREGVEREEPEEKKVRKGNFGHLKKGGKVSGLSSLSRVGKFHVDSNGERKRVGRDLRMLSARRASYTFRGSKGGEGGGNTNQEK